MSALRGSIHRPMNQIRNTRVFGWEAMLLMPIVPYMLMVVGTLGVLGASWGLRVWVRDRPLLMALMSAVLMLSAVALMVLGWKLFKPLTTTYPGIGFILGHHVAATVALAHVNTYVFMIFGSREFTWACWILGSIVIIVSWMLRRLARATTMTYGMDEGDPVNLAGSRFGQSFPHSRSGQRPVNGHAMARATPVVPIEYQVVKLGRGLVFKDATAARANIAAYRQLPLRAVRIERHPSHREDLAVIAITKQDPFKRRLEWPGAYLPGDSIAAPIEVGTYEDGHRVRLWFPGDESRNAQHYLTMGMPGAGKSKGWQCVLGSVLCRRDVIVLYGDAAKGIQTAGPLVEGLAWFADTEAKVKAMIGSIAGLIRDRTNWLAAKGLDEWREGCGLEYVILHLEEVAGLANKGFIKLAERARSAGITISLSLQRASGDRMNTSVRYNLGGSICFGCREVVDARFALMAETMELGATPHLWKNRKRGQFYLEADGVALDRFAIPCKVDWIDTNVLREVVRSGAQYRTRVSDVTARALGPEFARYRHEVERGETEWQALMDGRIKTRVIEADDPESGYPSSGAFVNATDHSSDLGNESTIDLGANAGPAITTAQADAIVWAWIRARKSGTEFTFTEMCSDLGATEGSTALPAIERSKTWLSLRLKRWIERGQLPPKVKENVYRVP